MALTTATIKSKLAQAGWSATDDVARSIVNGASAADLKSLDVEAVLRLYLSISSGWLAAEDKAALALLRRHTQFQPIATVPDDAVAVIQAATRSNACVQTELSAGMVTRIYAAEKKRLDWLEEIGFDGSTIGRGQLGQAAFTDVTGANQYGAQWRSWFDRYIIANYIHGHKVNSFPIFVDQGNFLINLPTHYTVVYRHEKLEDFIVAGYLAVLMKRTTKPGRSVKDVAYFAVALYHGMRKMVVTAQTATKNTVDWSPVEAHLLKAGHTDEIAYIKEVIK